MDAKVKTAFPGRPDEQANVRTIKVGEIIVGELAAVAVQQGWADPVEAENAASPPSVTTPAKAPRRVRKAR